MQTLIPFLETFMPEYHKELYDSLIDNLEDPFKSSAMNFAEVIQNNLTIIRKSLFALKTEILSEPFKDEAEEITYFKITKPNFHSLLIYWSELFEIEIHRPLGGIKIEEKYLKKHLRRLHWFFQEHAEFYAYYRSGKKYLDSEYFRINRNPNPNSSFTYTLEIDHRYTTEKDWLVAKFLGFEKVQEYIENALSTLRESNKSRETSATKNLYQLQWTYSKAGLVELVYALYSAGVYNNGNADIKSIARNFEQLFHVKLGNFYNVFNELRLKKTSRTQLLDTLREKVTQRMDDLDEQ